MPQLSTEDYLSDVFGRCRFKDPFYRLMYFHLKVSLPDDMLAKVDRMSMAHSLETRVPFLDHRLIELAWGVDKNIKLPGFNAKNLLKQTYGKRLPPALLKAPKKPFSVPLREWFKKREFEDRLDDLKKSDFGLNRAVIADIVRRKQHRQAGLWKFHLEAICSEGVPSQMIEESTSSRLRGRETSR